MFKTEKQDDIVSKMTIANKNCRYTYADYLTWDENMRCELIDGFVYSLPDPWLRHVQIKGKLCALIYPFINKSKSKYEILLAHFDVRLSLTGATDDDKIFNVVKPDICIVCDPSKLDERGCVGAPDLVIEILSPSMERRDFNEKFLLYETTGVREYWVVYPYDNALNVFILQDDGKYDKGMVYMQTGKVHGHVLKGLSIDLKKLFEK